MIPKIRTTLTPVEAPDDPKHRAQLAVYLGDSQLSTTLLELDDAPTCDKCGQALDAGHEYPVDEKGARHRGRCPKPKEPKA